MDEDDVTTSDVATTLVRSFKASPWLGVIILACSATLFVARLTWRVDAQEQELAQHAAQFGHPLLVAEFTNMRADIDTLKARQTLVLCALNPHALPQCELNRLRVRP